VLKWLCMERDGVYKLKHIQNRISTSSLTHTHFLSRTQKQVFGLQVPVHYVLGVHVLEPEDDVGGVELRGALAVCSVCVCGAMCVLLIQCVRYEVEYKAYILYMISHTHTHTHIHT
jgi:hypothetical protein